MDREALSTGTPSTTSPEAYVRPTSEKPRLSEVADWGHIPIIDLDCKGRAQIIEQIRDACRDYGFFQVVNHGLSAETIGKMLDVAEEFSQLPVEEKMKLYLDDPLKKTRLSTSFNVKKEEVHNWRDYLRLHCYPLDRDVPEWPSSPPNFKDTVRSYCAEVRQLGYRLQEAVAESSGLEKDYIRNISGEQGELMAVNHYPPCPKPESTYGLPGHAEPNALTMLLQDSHVAGLHALKDGKWVAVKPPPGALFINNGDQLQVTNHGASAEAVEKVLRADNAYSQFAADPQSGGPAVPYFSCIFSYSSVSSSSSISSPVWVLDTGATDHICCSLASFRSFVPSENHVGTLPNGDTVPIAGTGSVHLSNDLTLENVLFVPQFRYNLLSIGALTQQHPYSVSFYHDQYVIEDPTQGRRIGMGRKSGNLYILDLSKMYFVSP